MTEIHPQNSAGWYKLRAGKITASNFGQISRNKSGKGWGTAAVSLAYTLVGERLLLDNPEWTPPKQLETAAITHGNQWEPFARTAYILETAANIVEYGFLTHFTMPNVGASLDGVDANSSKTIEIKCPFTTREHVRTIHTGKVPAIYKPQVQGGLMVSGRDACDFVSFDHRVAENLTLCIVPTERDVKYISELEAKVEEFTEYVDKIEREVRNGRQS